MAADGTEEGDAAVMPVSTEEGESASRSANAAHESQLPDAPSTASSQLEFKQSNFTEYTPPSTNNNDDLRRSQRRPVADTFNSALEEAFTEEEQGKRDTTTGEGVGWFTIDRFKVYFNVNTDEVLLRLRAPFMPWGYKPAQIFSLVKRTDPGGPEELFLDTASTPDLYGPIWVSLTIVFLLTAVAQFNNTGKGEINRKEVEGLVLAATVVLGYLAIVPSVFFFVVKYQKGRIGLLRLYAAYGYSYVTFVPALLLCAVPPEFFGWLMMIVASFLGALFIARATYHSLSLSFADSKEKTYFIVGGFFVVHVILGVVLRAMFFSFYS